MHENGRKHAPITHLHSAEIPIPNFHILAYPFMTHAGGTTVQKFFNRFDSDRDRVISIPEFRAGLGDMGIKIDGPCRLCQLAYRFCVLVHPSVCLSLPVSVYCVYVSISLPGIMSISCFRAERNTSNPETNCCHYRVLHMTPFCV